MADGYSSKKFFSKEGSPTYIAVFVRPKLESMGVETCGIPDSLFRELRALLNGKE